MKQAEDLDERFTDDGPQTTDHGRRTTDDGLRKPIWDSLLVVVEHYLRDSYKSTK